MYKKNARTPEPWEENRGRQQEWIIKLTRRFAFESQSYKNSSHKTTGNDLDFELRPAEWASKSTSLVMEGDIGGLRIPQHCKKYCPTPQ